MVPKQIQCLVEKISHVAAKGFTPSKTNINCNVLEKTTRSARRNTVISNGQKSARAKVKHGTVLFLVADLYRPEPWRRLCWKRRITHRQSGVYPDTILIYIVKKDRHESCCSGIAPQRWPCFEPTTSRWLIERRGVSGTSNPRRCGHTEPLGGVELLFKINSNGNLIAWYEYEACVDNRDPESSLHMGASET
jgi:hypothetical protein